MAEVTMQQCPKRECTIENHVHGHGTDEMYLPKQTERRVMEQKAGSLESLLCDAFSAGYERGAYDADYDGSTPVPPDYDEWRRRMLPDPTDA